MKDSFVKFCQQINFKIPSHLEGSLVNNVFFDKSINEPKIFFDLSFFSLPSIEELSFFVEKSKIFFQSSEIEFNFSFINKNYSKERIFDILAYSFDYLFKKNIERYFDINLLDYDISNNVLKINFNNIINFHNFQNEIEWKKIYSFVDIKDIKIKIAKLFEINFENEIKEQEKTDEITFKKLKEKTNKKVELEKNVILEKSKNNNKYFNVSLSNFYLTHEKNLYVEGKIFNVEIIKTKTNLKIMLISISDNDEAILCKIFERDDEIFEKHIQYFKENDYISVWGEKKQEYNLPSFFLHIKKIEKIKESETNAFEAKENNRIEFSVKTSMSAMDGFINAKDYLDYAKKNKYISIGFSDFQNIQAFPEIYLHSKKIGVKPIYGCTFSIIEKKHNLVLNVKNLNSIEKEKYVVFDIETTSLNPRTGEIIEFGAVVIENLKTIKNIQFFIKPSQPISQSTEELTGISQKMLDNDSKFFDQKTATEEILKIFENSTVVAHNAQFDIGFIKEKMHQYNLGQFKNQVIDTLAISRFLYPFSNSHRLEIIAKKMNVNYDPTVAHRADYDANVLVQIWLKMINMLTKNKSIKTFDQLSNIKDDLLNNKKYGYDLNIYAKNQKGLKELFKLVSTSLTDSFFGSPKIFEEDIIKSNNLLIGPASFNSKLINLAFTGTSEEINKEISKWDFIGIPSPHLFRHLIQRDNLTKEEIENNLKKIILEAKKQNKIIIAISEPRYIEKNDYLAHVIYINTKGLEGKRHNLYKYNETNPKYPFCYFLSTSEMKKQFEFLNSENLIEEIVIKNTHLLNNLIEENIEVIKTKLFSPNFDNSQEKLNKLVYDNAKKIYGENLNEKIEKRIKKELDSINKYGFSVVYWISQKLVSKSLEDGYLVGSRGSVGSSIVATLSGITEVNPLEPHYICKNCKYVEFVENYETSSGFDLPPKKCPKCNNDLISDGQTIPFETFLGFYGDKVPDIDLNFSGEYQHIIHNEVKKIFGENHAFRAGTISTVASKTAFGFVKKFFEEKNIEKSNIFINYLSKKIEGSKRTTGQHPGGIIIIPKEFNVEDFTPVNYPANDINSSWKTTHFDFHAIHDNVLKLDLLGHDDPTVIKHLQSLTNVDIKSISFSDQKVMSLFSSTESLGIKPENINNEQTGVLGIPEFGTKFVRKMLKVAKPKTFNDLINISGLSHGTDVWNGNAEELVKSGKSLNEVISCRDDIMNYLISKNVEPSIAFQIMENVRKGKGLTKEQETMLNNKGIETWYIKSLNKIKYMFPKAHATAYVMMAWRIAWFKIYYPIEYYATFFTVRPDVFDIESALGSKNQIEKKLIELEQKQHSKEKLSAKEEELITIFEIINEMLARGIKISNINLYKSKAFEWVIDYDNNSLIPPFSVLDGLGESAAKSIVEARAEKKFTSIADLVKRTQINKTILEKMEKLKIIKDLEKTDQLKLF